MLSKLKTLTKVIKKDKPIIDLSSLQTNLSEGLFNTMESSFKQRKSDTRNSSLGPDQVDRIIKEYAHKNMVLAAASSVVPGPLGILSSIPELLLNFGNQMNMIYDLGCAHGKENFINKDVLLDIPFAAFGGNTDLARLQDIKADLSDSPKELLIQKATDLSKTLIEKSLKKSIVQFIPVAGPVLMASWAQMTTYKISKSSSSFLDSSRHYKEHFKKEETPKITQALQIEKIKGLCNLIEANNEFNENQIQMIRPIIQNATITDDQKEFYLAEALKNNSNFEIDFQLLKDYEEDESLILELVILAKRSGHIDEYEKEYIYNLGHQLEIDSAFIDTLL